MFVLGYFFKALAVILGGILKLYMWVVIIRALLTWVNPDPYNPIVRFLTRITEPLLMRLRNRFPVLYRSGIDFSPMVVILVIVFLQIFLVGSLWQLAMQF